MHDLIETESLIGGALFREAEARFWLHPPTHPNSPARDWYFSFTRGDREYTIHYQTNEHGIQKIYNGRNYPFTDGEQARLVEAMNAYYERVTVEVYGRQYRPAVPASAVY